jgi:DNA-binding MarR family transcriptional regulator
MSALEKILDKATSKTADKTTSKARLRLWLRLLKASKLIETELRERMRRELDTTLPRFDVMAALSRNPEGLKMSALSGVLKVSNGNVTGIVERLVEDGFVRRDAVENDRRAFLAKLTDAGRAEFARQAEAHEAWVDELLDDVEPERAERLAQLLGEVAAHMEEEN